MNNDAIARSLESADKILEKLVNHPELFEKLNTWFYVIIVVVSFFLLYKFSNAIISYFEKRRINKWLDKVIVTLTRVETLIDEFHKYVKNN